MSGQEDLPMPGEFDRPVERRGTSSLKWDLTAPGGAEGPVLPVWVADMDFVAPDEVVAAVRARAEHGVYGYTIRPASYYEAVIEWMERRFRWPVHREWIVFAPGIVPAVHLAVQAFTEPGDRVIIQSPVYHPFASAIVRNGRDVFRNRLVEEGLRYRMDLGSLEEQLDSRTRLLILCSPHNPVGRVWQRGELEALGELCLRHRLVVVSDEIHQDLLMPGFTHMPLASVSPELAESTITCTAPNKTFNIAGLQLGNVIIQNPELRERFSGAVAQAGLGMATPFGIAACEAAYRHGEGWLTRLLTYLHANYRLVCDFAAAHLPQVKVTPLEGTYLVWLDFRASGLDDVTLRKRLFEKGRVWLDEGPKFGPGGEGFQRLNIGCPRATLQDALERIAIALRPD